MANTVYANKVIEAKAKDLLTTAVNARSMMTVDTSLTATAGMKKVINTYTYSGAAEVVAEGKGNTTRGSISHVPSEYTVLCVQQTFDYTDEDYMKDPSIVDNMLKGATQLMSNKMTADLNTECAKATVAAPFSTAISYDAIVDGISELNLEDESKCFIRLPNAWKKDIRKDADYKAARMGEVVYSGQMGTVSGLPVVPTKALANEAYVMTNEAVTLFLKKDVEVEQKRDIETRTNTVVLRAFYICALTDATKICKLSKGA
jgi:hypothetical protein